MSQNHFRSQEWPFQIDTELFLAKPAAIWMGRQCQLSNSSEIFGAGGHFGCPKSLSIAFLAISDRYGSSFF